MAAWRIAAEVVESEIAVVESTSVRSVMEFVRAK